MSKYVFLFTDIEADGPIPGPYSMISFASVARSDNGTDLGEFEANLLPLERATQFPDTMAWWKTQPEAWQYCNSNQKDPTEVIPKYVCWIESLPGIPVLVSHPVCFDYMWIRWYLQTFTGKRVFPGPGLDLVTYAMATMGWDFFDSHRDFWPQSWLGGHLHSHKAIDDARGYACAYFEIKKLNDSLKHPKIVGGN